MNKALVAALAASTALSASTAYAGGPIIVEEVEEVVERPASTGILPILIGIVVICAIVCNQDDDDTPQTPPPVPPGPPPA